VRRTCRAAHGARRYARAVTSPRRLLRAELLAIGTELTVGEVRDTNGGDLARELTALGVTVTRLVALRDDLADVVAALRDALARSDLVVTSGGLGPTPDDLTRESIAAVCGETPAVDPALEAWVRDLFDRRGVRFAERNLKQAWLIPSARAIPNPNGTAPGWWIDAPDGRVIVALPGPPRELHAMWEQGALPLLRRRGVGMDTWVRTLRVTGLGESLVAEALGDDILLSGNPVVATYARADGIDVRISAQGEEGGVEGETEPRTARALVEAIEPVVGARIVAAGGLVFGHDDDTWPVAIGRRLGNRRVACLEIGTEGSLEEIIGKAPWFEYGAVEDLDGRGAARHADLIAAARRVQWNARVDIGIAVRVTERGPDTRVEVAIVTGGAPDDATYVVRKAFLTGSQGRQRAAVTACAELWGRLG
jgi:nicotinamide-nucleotide amidase